jgi:hypothetical protein
LKEVEKTGCAESQGDGALASRSLLPVCRAAGVGGSNDMRGSLKAGSELSMQSLQNTFQNRSEWLLRHKMKIHLGMPPKPVHSLINILKIIPGIHLKMIEQLTPIF